MRFAALVLCFLAAAMWCSTVQAGEKKAKVYEGWINNLPDNTIAMNESVDGHTLRRIIYVGDETTITVNGKPGSHASLAKGMIIRVTMKNAKIAASVEAVTPKKKSW
jgi:hypothetical protein